ncbi:TolC family protein [Myxococcota bacterium]|nr:TolC family protein [Myxococcota bacterium]
MLWLGWPSSLQAASVQPEDAPFPTPPRVFVALPTFADLWAQTASHNPTLQRIRSQFAVAAARIKQAGAWPDLEIGIQANNFPLPNFRPNMMTGIQYSIGQKFPILGRLAAQKAIAQAELHKLHFLLQESQTKIAYELREHLLALFDLRLQWHLRRELYQITQQIAAVARTRYAASTSRKQDLLLALLQLAQLQQEALQIQRQAQRRLLQIQRLTSPAPSTTARYSQTTAASTAAAPSARTTAASTAARYSQTTASSTAAAPSARTTASSTAAAPSARTTASSTAAVPSARTTASSTITPPTAAAFNPTASTIGASVLSETQVATQPVTSNLLLARWARALKLPMVFPKDQAVAWEEVLRSRPMLRYWHSDALQAKQLKDLAQAQYWPEIMLRLTIQQRFENSADQGEPFLSFGIQIPLPTWGNSARQGLAEEATARFVTAQKRLRELLSDLRQQLSDTFQESRNLREQQQLTNTQLLPLALQTYQASLASYQVGKEDFSNLLGHLKRYLSIRLQSQRLDIALLTQHARLIALQGKPL